MEIKYLMILVIFAGCTCLIFNSYRSRKFWNKHWYSMLTELFVDSMIFVIATILILVIAIAG